MPAARPPVVRTRASLWLRRSAIGVAIVAAVATLGTRASGQRATSADPPRLRPVTVERAILPSENRAREFETLARDVAALEPQLGIFKRVARLVTPSVVHIEASPASRRGVRSDSHEAGSGVVVRFGGADYVLTNRHVIRNSAPRDIEVRLAGGDPIRPTRVWSDKETDIAVMAIDGAGPLKPALLGDSGALEIGEQVLAFGSPFGLSQSVTRGILSAKGRYNLDLGDGDVRYQNFLQTDAAINPGNSGGPLVNLRGEVIGLNTAIASSSGGSEGIGFSIPIDIATRIARQLITTGEPIRGYLGVNLDVDFAEDEAIDVGLPRPIGARVTGVKPDSPADQASLLPDDVILRYDGVRVEDDEHLINLVKLTEAGRRVEVELFRGGSMLRTVAQIGRN